MKYRELGKTGCFVSEIGLGGEWLERHNTEEVNDIIATCHEKGINILDCWMSEPNVRSNIGKAIREHRAEWMIQGHFGSTWQNGQYVKTRDLKAAKEAFQDLLTRLQTTYIDFGMIHFVDEVKEFETIMSGCFFATIKEMKDKGIVRHIGLSTHNPAVAALAAESKKIELILFSINPAFDLLPPTEDLNLYFASEYAEGLYGIAPERTALYELCERNGVGLTVMKAYAGGRLFSKENSPFQVALTPVQCIHYALTRPAVASVMVGYDTPAHVEAAVAYESASEEEKDYASVLAGAPKHAFSGQCTYCGHCSPCPVKIDIAMVNKLYDLAKMQPDVPPSVRAHYQSLSANASVCIGCRSCETRCPFRVSIAERMKKAADLF